MSKIVTHLILIPTWSLTRLPFVRYKAIVEAVFGTGGANKQVDGPDRLAIVTRTNFAGLVDPHPLGQRRRLGQTANESLRIFLKGTLQH